MAEFASKGVAGAGLGTGIAGLSLGVLNSMGGSLGKWLTGNNYNYGDICCVNRYELAQESKIAKLESDIALRDANIYNDQKLLELYKYFDGEVKDIRSKICANEKEQAVINSKFESGVNVLGSQLSSISNTISNLTKTIIPNGNVCPGWGNTCVQSTGCSCTNGFNGNI